MTPARALLLNGRVVTERLALEPLTSDHADSLWAPMQAPAIFEWISATPPATVALLRERWSAQRRYLSPSGKEAWLGWAIRRTSDQVFIGKADAVVDPSDVATNLGYLLFPQFWGHGYASEAARGLAEHLERQGVGEIRASVTLGNHASCRVLEKAGFVRTCILPENDRIRGVMVDDVEYVRRAPER